MKAGELAKALRGLADGFWDKDYFVVDSGDFDLKEKQAEIEKAMRDAADTIEEQASRIELWSNRSDELVEAVNRHYRRPVRNCDRVADFRDAKMKFLAHNGQGGSNYCRRLCHWLLSPITERKPET